jgi:hypothetical protein
VGKDGRVDDDEAVDEAVEAEHVGKRALDAGVEVLSRESGNDWNNFFRTIC